MEEDLISRLKRIRRVFKGESVQQKVPIPSEVKSRIKKLELVFRNYDMDEKKALRDALLGRLLMSRLKQIRRVFSGVGEVQKAVYDDNLPLDVNCVIGELEIILQKCDVSITDIRNEISSFC